MTVCIAAACRDGGYSAIILCTDGKGSLPLGSKDHQKKIHELPCNWRCLAAGREDDIAAFLRLLRAEFKGAGLINETNVELHICEALRKRKDEKADAYTGKNWGMTYSTFLGSKAKFPDPTYASEIEAIKLIAVEVDCIVTGFDEDGVPLIVSAGGDGTVGISSHFAVAGSGSDLALYGLLHRQLTEHEILDFAIYCVYEAKLHAQREAHVNDVTDFYVLHQDGRVSYLLPNGREALENCFKKYGPKSLDENVCLPTGSFQTYTWKPSAAPDPTADET